MEARKVSRPAFPLGMAAVGGRGKKKRVPIIDPDAEPEEHCPICLDRMPWCGHLDLICGHAACAQCLGQDAITRFLTAGARTPFPCPLCRTDCRVSAYVADEIGQAQKIDKLHAIADAFGNWHVVLKEYRGQVFAVKSRSSRAYSMSQTVFINPYKGWIVPNGAPAHNPNFTRYKPSDSLCRREVYRRLLRSNLSRHELEYLSQWLDGVMDGSQREDTNEQS